MWQAKVSIKWINIMFFYFIIHLSGIVCKYIFSSSPRYATLLMSLMNNDCRYLVDTLEYNPELYKGSVKGGHEWNNSILLLLVIIKHMCLVFSIWSFLLPYLTYRSTIFCIRRGCKKCIWWVLVIVLTCHLAYFVPRCFHHSLCIIEHLFLNSCIQ